MKPCDFYMDQTGAGISQLDFLSSKNMPPSAMAKAMVFPNETIISLEWIGEHTGPWAYRLHDGSIYVASLQGPFSIAIGTASNGNILLAMQHPESGGFYEHLDISVFSEDWRARDASPRNPEDFKVKQLPDGSFEPICWRQTFRGLEDGFREWVILYLPAPADSIRRRKGQAIIESGGHTFTLPKGDVSSLALKGKIQYAIPDDNGNFVFGPVPAHPTDGLMAKVVRDLLAEMGIQKGS